MHLAGHLHMSYGRLLDEVDSREITKWMAYDRLHPLDHAGRAEFSSAYIASILYNVNRAEHAPAKSIGDMMQDHGKPYRHAIKAEAEATPVKPIDEPSPALDIKIDLFMRGFGLGD